jgi:hypothetical protein
MNHPCRTRKVRYTDNLAARIALAAIERKTNRAGGERRAYRCQHCRGWHLTSR